MIKLVGRAACSIFRLGSLRGNTKIHRAETALQDSEQQYRLLIDGLQEYAILKLGTLGEIASWSPGAERMTGEAFEEVAGRNFAAAE